MPSKACETLLYSIRILQYVSYCLGRFPGQNAAPPPCLPSVRLELTPQPKDAEDR